MQSAAHGYDSRTWERASGLRGLANGQLEVLMAGQSQGDGPGLGHRVGRGKKQNREIDDSLQLYSNRIFSPLTTECLWNLPSFLSG